MKHFVILIVLFLVGSIAQAQSSFPATPMPRPADFEYLAAPDSTGYRKPLRMPDTTIFRKTMAVVPKIPYPIIFVHGLLSNDQTWDTYTNYLMNQYGFTYGGRFDYCLNYDDDNSYSNTVFAPNQWADMAIFNGTWNAGDIYVINFDVGDNGGVYPSTSSSSYVKSNQSAIVKQGKALQDAIARVLQLTGREKVVLMGHSMGGLASREYVQNTYNWQPDGYHHVAKVVTTGTPHGGSNTTTIGIFGPDGQTEAVRDLRRSYTYSGNAGVYLFGGIEDLTYMEDQLLFYFYNSDVNCDGTGGAGTSITGINQKPIYSNIDYSCIIGDCSGCLVDLTSGDGVVNINSANLNNFYPALNADLFYYYTSALTEVHTDLPGLIYENFQGLDESDDFHHSYHVGLDTSYSGFITEQALNNTNYPLDYDTYHFEVSQPGDYSISISNINSPDLYVAFADTAQNVLGTVANSAGNASLFNKVSLLPGKYYVVIFASPINGIIHSYDFQLTMCPVVTFTATQTILCAGGSSLFTGSLVSGSNSFVNWSFSGGTPASSSLASLSVQYTSAGTWPVTLVASNQCGNDTAHFPAYVEVYPVPSAPQVSTPPASNFICRGETVSALFGVGSGGVNCQDQFVYVIDGGVPLVYVPGTQIGSNALTSVVIESRRTNCAPGISCNTNTSQVSWSVIAPPAAPSVSLSGNVLTSSSPTGNQWFLNGNPIPGETGVNLNCALYGNGSYSVQVTNSYGCESGMSILTYVTITDISPEVKDANISLYPNPSEGILNLYAQGNWAGSNLDVLIWDVNGKVVFQTKLNPNPSAKLNVTDLPAGSYIVRIVKDSTTLHKQIVILK